MGLEVELCIWRRLYARTPTSKLACFASNRWQLVLPQRSVLFPSLIRFSTSPRPCNALPPLPAGSLELVTMNPILGKSSPECHSILAITLRQRISEVGCSRQALMRLCSIAHCNAYRLFHGQGEMESPGSAGRETQ